LSGPGGGEPLYGPRFTLTIDKRFGFSLRERSDNHGGTLSTLHGKSVVDIENVASLPVADITWK
jgi:hypothetical protein